MSKSLKPICLWPKMRQFIWAGTLLLVSVFCGYFAYCHLMERIGLEEPHPSGTYICPLTGKVLYSTETESTQSKPLADDIANSTPTIKQQ